RARGRGGAGGRRWRPRPAARRPRGGGARARGGAAGARGRGGVRAGADRRAAGSQARAFPRLWASGTIPDRMRTHPVFLRLEGRRCVVVGGDAPALVKARACIEAGAEVSVVAPEMSADLAGIRHVARAYRAGDLAGAFLAYASTRDPELICRLADEAESERVLLNVIDVPEACTFIAPAVVRRGSDRKS